MDQISFEYARHQDLPRIVEIYNQAIPTRIATADLEPVTVADREAWFASFNETSRPIWLIKYQGQIAGWVSLSDFYGRPAYAHTAEVSIYLDPVFQGKGLGSAAIKYVEDQTAKLGLTRLVGFVFSHNMASLALLKKFGFVKWGELPDVALMDGKLRSLTILGWIR